MDPIFTFSKKINNSDVTHGEISDAVDVSKLGAVLQSLDALPGVMTYPLDEIGLKTNPRKWITALVFGHPDPARPDIENLLFDFTDMMQTRMREETKYALGLLMAGKLVLCHSTFGEETITPEWRIIPRMLDRDNVLRYVCFCRDNGQLLARFWEREATSSFVEWLGLPRKQAFMMGGKYSIRCEIDDTTTELQLTEQEMLEWLRKHPEFVEGKIRFPSPVQSLSINEIRAGRKRYQSPADFIQDFQAEQHGIPHYEEAYARIEEAQLPLLITYYDEKSQVVRKEGDQETIEVMKDTASFDILFVNEHIELRASYAADLARRFINGEALRIFHAGLRFRFQPFKLGSMSIYNEVRLNPLAQHVVDYYNETKLNDACLSILFQYVVLRLLGEANSGTALEYLCRSLCNEIARDLVFEGKLIKIEDTVIEYKSRDALAGKHEKIIEDLAQDLGTKLSRNCCKVYFVGVEDDGEFSPVSASRLSSDRLEGIRKDLQGKLPNADIIVFPAIRNEAGLLLIAAFSN